MIYYKIRDKETGMFSTGGTRPTWHKDGGKIWTKFPGSHLALHRKGYNTYRDGVLPFDRVEVVAYELVEKDVKNIASFKQDQIEKQNKREAKLKEQAAQYELTRKKNRLESLKEEVAHLTAELSAEDSNG